MSGAQSEADLTLKRERRSARRKVLWVALAMVAGALEPIVAKWGYRYNLHPLPLFIVRNLVAAVVLAPILLSKRQLTFANLKLVIAPALLLMTTGFCTLLALSYLSAVTVITVVTTTPAVVAIVNQKMGRDRLGKFFWLGFAMCFAGVVISLDLNSFACQPIGLVAVLVAVLTSSFYRVLMEQLTDAIDPASASSASFFVIGALSLLAVPFLLLGNSPQYQMPSLEALPLCGMIGVSAAIANVTFVTAMNRVGSTRISLISMLQRPLLILIAAICLQERPGLIQLLGIVLVMVGMNFTKVTRSVEAAPAFRPQVAQTEP
jgi:drug/metabolite transporter (DMT)-like permease